MKKLNLGCGNKKLKGYINVDNNPLCKPDIILDLNKGLKKFKTNSFDLIRAEHILEHVDDLQFVLEEMYRVSKPGAIWEIFVPHYSYGFAHPLHKRGFSYGFFSFFNNKNSESYGNMKFKILKTHFKYTRMNNLFLKIIGVPIDFLANLHKGFCERFWCYLVGGFEEIQIRVKVEK
ncbi:MAG: methyltransferase domain-containing protein [Candidatus Omnitrophica bacterium]|nr:methyltransferase domain-containing protein [Candidatus Omnitrophota bacterium]